MNSNLKLFTGYLKSPSRLCTFPPKAHPHDEQVVKQFPDPSQQMVQILPFISVLVKHPAYTADARTSINSSIPSAIINLFIISIPLVNHGR